MGPYSTYTLHNLLGRFLVLKKPGMSKAEWWAEAERWLEAKRVTKGRAEILDFVFTQLRATYPCLFLP